MKCIQFVTFSFPFAGQKNQKVCLCITSFMLWAYRFEDLFSLNSKMCLKVLWPGEWIA